MSKNKLEIIEITEDQEKMKLIYTQLKPKIELFKTNFIKNNIKTPLTLFLSFIILFTLFFIFFYLFIFNPSYNNDYYINIQSKSGTGAYIIDKTKYNKFNKYDKKGKEIYLKEGTLSFNKLEEIFYNNTMKKTDKFDHIHIAMSFNNDYYLLSTITIASLLKNANKNTYIHLHIIAVGEFLYPTMKKLNSLKLKINNNTEFIFHNGNRVEKDFGKHIKNDSNGMPEYSRFLAPYLVNNTDRIIVLDSADLFIEKDLLELYNYPLEDKLIKGVIDPFTNCFPHYTLFHKENYINGGVLLFNSKRWREMDLYQDIVNFYKAFDFKGKLPTPIQDILNTFFPAISLGLLPLEYNFQGYVDINGNDDYFFSSYIYGLKRSKFYNKKKQLIKYEKNLVIRHCNKYKVHTGEARREIKNKWIYYAKMTGFYEELCNNYPPVCEYY